MSKQWMHFEDNEDGTTTITAKLEDFDEELTFVLAMSFEEIATSFSPQVQEEADAIVHSAMTLIPNTLED